MADPSGEPIGRDAATSTRCLILVKHAQPLLDAATPPRAWRLAPEGEVQAAALAGRLRAYLPFRLVASPEPKAVRTAAITGKALGLALQIIEGLQEIDRPALPILPPDEHRRLNASIFARHRSPVLGTESAAAALKRFGAALDAALAAAGREHVVAVTHGTVIALYVAAHNPVDGYTFWCGLSCGDFAVLSLPHRRILEVVRPVGGTT